MAERSRGAPRIGGDHHLARSWCTSSGLSSARTYEIITGPQCSTRVREPTDDSPVFSPLLPRCHPGSRQQRDGCALSGIGECDSVGVGRAARRQFHAREAILNGIAPMRCLVKNILERLSIAKFTEERTDIFDKEPRLLECREVPTGRHLGPAAHVIAGIDNCGAGGTSREGTSRKLSAR